MRLALLALFADLAAGSSVEPAPLKTANHIFNAIHSSMRQWGSSLDHNGMSFFLASVPEGTQLYHGRHSSEPVKGIEWLAFEPEHAMVFAQHPPGGPGGGRPGGGPPGRGPPGGGPPGGGPPGEGPPRPDGSGESAAGKKGRARTKGHHPPNSPPGSEYHDADWDRPRWMRNGGVEKQEPMRKGGFKSKDEGDESGGHLHTYRTKHPLSLLYIDGMSAGKTRMGTLDSTDTVMLRFDPDAHNRKGDDVRAEGLCNLTDAEWGGRIDGFLRMEMGFEIILCDFEKHLDVDRVTQTAGRKPGNHGPGGMSDLTYYRAVAARFDGIGGDRVRLNYDDFVTSFAYDADLFQDGALPRLVNVSNATISMIHDDVTKMVLSHLPPAKNVPTTTNWQKIADMVVERYSSRLPYLVSSAVSSLEDMQTELEALLRPYIDYGSRNSTAEIERCATSYLPPSAIASSSSIPLAALVIRDVTTTICGTFVSASNASSLSSAQAEIEDLMAYLKWTTWKRCTGCGVDEVCFIPIWPAGRVQDYEHPACQSSLPTDRQDSYWGGFGPGGRGPGGKGGAYPYPYHYPPFPYPSPDEERP